MNPRLPSDPTNKLVKLNPADDFLNIKKLIDTNQFE